MSPKEFHMRGTCVLLLLVCAPMRAGIAADMPVPVRNALALMSTVEMPRLLLELCTARAPESVAKNNESYEAWRKKYDEISASAWRLLEERNEVLAPMLKTFTEGNITSVREAVSFTATLLNKNADARGESYVQKMCTTYPEFLETMNEDFEPKVTSQMDALKASFQ